MNESWTQYLPHFLRTRLEGRQQLQKVIGNTGWLFFDSIIRIGVGLLVSIWVTRYLGPEQFGILSYARTFLILFTPIATLGLEGIVVRNITRAPSCRDEILGSAFFLKLIGGVATLGLAFLSISLHKPADRLLQMLVAVSAFGTIFQSFGVIDFWFISQMRSKFSVYARTGAFIVSNLIKILLVVFEAPLLAFAWAGAADMILAALGFVLAYRAGRYRISDWKVCRSMVVDLMRDCWPLMLADVVMLIYMRVDKIMLGDMAGNKELGIYAVAAMLTESLYFIPAAVTSSMYPSIVEAARGSEQQFQALLQKSYSLMAFLGYAVALPVTFLASWMIPLLFGAAYSRASLMLVGLAWAGLFYNLSLARGSFLAAMNWTRIQFLVDLLGCLLNIALNLYLIPRYGGMGAVFASLIAYWFVAHGACFLFRPLVGTGSMITKAMVYPKFW
jgi:O-antigen/teichoic acid export membrane protein